MGVLWINAAASPPFFASSSYIKEESIAIEESFRTLCINLSV